MAIATEESYVTPKMIQLEDDVIMTKGAAIEATAVLAMSFPETTERRLGSKLARRAAAYLRRCSTVEDALSACTVGVRSNGVTAMHDATEGGVLGGLYELAHTSGLTLRIELEKIHVSTESRSVCSAFGIDPLVTLSEGALLITCRPASTLRVLRKLVSGGIEARKIGSAVGRSPRLEVSQRGSTRGYVPPRFDPYWEVYAKGVKKGWK